MKDISDTFFLIPPSLWTEDYREEYRELRCFIFQERSARTWSPWSLLFPVSENNRDRVTEEIRYREKQCFQSSLTYHPIGDKLSAVYSLYICFFCS